MYGILIRYLPGWLANILMTLWIITCLLAIIWFWDIESQSFRYLEL